jgi:hypothetical protein
MRRDRVEDPLDRDAAEFVSLVFSYFVDDATPAGQPRAVGREVALRVLRGERLDDLGVDGGVPLANGEQQGWPTSDGRPPSEPPDRETWGLLPEHIDGLNRAIGMMAPTLAAGAAE